MPAVATAPVAWSGRSRTDSDRDEGPVPNRQKRGTTCRSDHHHKRMLSNLAHQLAQVGPTPREVVEQRNVEPCRRVGRHACTRRLRHWEGGHKVAILMAAIRRADGIDCHCRPPNPAAYTRPASGREHALRARQAETGERSFPLHRGAGSGGCGCRGLQNLSTTAVSTAVFDMSRSRGQTPE